MKKTPNLMVYQMLETDVLSSVLFQTAMNGNAAALGLILFNENNKFSIKN